MGVGVDTGRLRGCGGTGFRSGEGGSVVVDLGDVFFFTVDHVGVGDYWTFGTHVTRTPGVSSSVVDSADTGPGNPGSTTSTTPLCDRTRCLIRPTGSRSITQCRSGATAGRVVSTSSRRRVSISRSTPTRRVVPVGRWVGQGWQCVNRSDM